jgi:pimeloyl-ACP methyl ester carboxylesterase
MGPAVVFVHGLFQGLGHLRNLSYPGSGRVLVVDPVGYGEHERSGAPTTMRAQADHVVAELDRHRVPRATLIGHSIGGAVAMLAAASQPDRVAAVVNVEGNFTLADAFWSSRVATMTAAEAEAMLAGFRRDPEAWLVRQTIEPTPRRIAWARQMFDAQPSSSVQALATAVVETTAQPEFLRTIEGVLDAGMPVHLLAGERSRAGWAVPDVFVRRAASFTTQPQVGHMMPIEDPDRFLTLVAALAR